MSLFNVFFLSPIAVILYTVMYFMYLDYKDKCTKGLVLSYFKILGFNTLACLFPFFTLGLFFGFPAVLLSSILLTVSFREKLS